MAFVHLHVVGELVMPDYDPLNFPTFTRLRGARDQLVVCFASIDPILADDPTGKDGPPEAAGFNRRHLNYA